MKKYSLSIPLVAIIVAGCDPVSQRDCGVFDHPDLIQWQANQSASVVSFMSEDGSMISFQRDVPVLNEPFLGEDESANNEDVVCTLEASVRYTATDSSLTITSVFQQLERLLIESVDENLYIDHIVETPISTELAGNYLADICLLYTSPSPRDRG